VSTARWRLFFVAFLILTLTYCVTDFLLIPANRLELHPLHHDDYTNLGLSLNAIKPRPPRPASTLAIALLATAGTRAYYIALNFLTIVYPALVILFLARLFGRDPSPLATCAAAAFLFSFPTSVEWAKYTGLMTNLLSGIFGVLALLCIHCGLAGERRNRTLAAGVVFYAISIFCKEDFALPVVILIGFYLTERNTRVRRRAALVLGAAVACMLALFHYNSGVLDSFTRLATSGPYQTRFTPISVVSTFFRYLTLTRFLVAALIILVVTAVATAVTLRESRRPILLAFSMIGSLIVPYSVLPNHIAFYYPYGWLAWMAGVIGICLTVLAARIPGRALLYSSFALLALLAVWQTQPERKAIVHWYNRESDRNERITQTLMANRAALASLDVVGVVGIAGLSPWSHSSGNYLRTRLHLDNRWIVFVPGNDMFYSLDKTEPGSRDESVQVRSLSEVARWPELPLLVFDEKGRGRLVRRPAKRRAADGEEVSCRLSTPHGTGHDLGNPGIAISRPSDGPAVVAIGHRRRVSAALVDPDRQRRVRSPLRQGLHGITSPAG
jgi:hypothetical protein